MNDGDEAKSVVATALVKPCTICDAAIGEPCRNEDGTLVQIKGHLGVHGTRMVASLGTKRGTA